MGTRYRVVYKESEEIAEIKVGEFNTEFDAKAVKLMIAGSNPAEEHLYFVEAFEDPDFTPPEPEPIPEPMPLVVTQESLDARLAETAEEGKTDTATKEQRINICTPCEFNKPFMGFGQCNQCGCFIYLKAMIKNSTCPEGKW